jgi:hypothetical protein
MREALDAPDSLAAQLAGECEWARWAEGYWIWGDGMFVYYYTTPSSYYVQYQYTPPRPASLSPCQESCTKPVPVPVPASNPTRRPLYQADLTCPSTYHLTTAALLVHLTSPSAFPALLRALSCLTTLLPLRPYYYAFPPTSVPPPKSSLFILSHQNSPSLCVRSSLPKTAHTRPVRCSP